ncbi:PfpI family protease [Natrialba magadii ATCC 43099]|uniref:PfpI family protease n=1 Tax=Natrialba magadii (strain ATCC 43099 / DSM 3394 / CCM 3739 / CIP 104546 / IAM 13178 / JCM 8861 / NBRC 102185 / NCIMB 2190 / MS3) TaxID=547559 RepID=D3SUJ5_NATMM|nr:DJ-1/PfpI family protein [Natrialba magadii]ADD05253.1 PfpI family protease [Natrialba magadii ATCC 43099]ELY29025.1 ThiJ/PfpI domain-containing protein [Natrialba magadii ATCC 43099]
MVDITAEIILFDGFDELDAIGPYEVLENGAQAGASIDTNLVTLEETDLVTASHDLRVEPDGTLGNPDLLLVPGGGWTTSTGGVRLVVDEGELPAAVDECYTNGATVASVCTGAMILAEAGLLEGRPATTHPAAVDDLEETAANVVDERVVDDGDVLTAGGVTSGIDLGLWLLEREFDESIADEVAAEMIHDRRGEIFG